MSEREYVIFSDATVDMPVEYINENDVKLLYMTYTLEGKEYLGDAEHSMEPHAFYESLRGGNMATTAQINTDTFTNAFRQVIQEGKDILYLAFSSGLSGTYNSARIAVEDLKEEFPEAKILVVDSLCASMGEGLLLHYLIENKKKGMSLEENAAWAEENKLHVAHWFTVDDLNHLYRGGRVSKTAAFVGTLLGIKPVLHVDDEGHLIPMEKVRGRAKSLESLCAHMKETAIDPSAQTIFISHGDCEDEAKVLADMIKKEIGMKDIRIHPIGPVVGTHSGPGTLALFFIATKR